MKAVGEDGTPFFDYPLLKPPLAPYCAKAIANEFVKCVCEAFKELHDAHIAHLDVRLVLLTLWALM